MHVSWGGCASAHSRGKSGRGSKLLGIEPGQQLELIEEGRCLWLRRHRGGPAAKFANGLDQADVGPAAEVRRRRARSTMVCVEAGKLVEGPDDAARYRRAIGWRSCRQEAPCRRAGASATGRRWRRTLPRPASHRGSVRRDQYQPRLHSCR